MNNIIKYFVFIMIFLSFPVSGRSETAIQKNLYFIGQDVYFNPYTGIPCTQQEAWNVFNQQNKCFKWNVIKDNGDTIELILDHNLGDKVAWADEVDFIAAGGTEEEYAHAGNNKYGPITALKELKKVTEDFKNVDPLTPQDAVTRLNADGTKYKIDYNGYKARLISAQELADIVNNKKMEDGKIWNSSSLSYIHNMPGWLYTNLGMPDQPSVIHVAYYTDTAHTARKDTVWVICLGSNLGKGSVTAAKKLGREILGIRPVIKLKKSVLHKK